MNLPISRCLSILTLFGVSVANCTAAAPTTRGTDDEINFDRNSSIGDGVIGISSSWVIWCRATVVPGTERKVAPTYLRRFFVQHPDDLRGTEVYRGTDVGGGATALPDGTVLLEGYRLFWAAAGQPARLERGQNLNWFPDAMFPDGLVMHTPNPGKGDDVVTLWWVPIINGWLDHESQMRLDEVANDFDIRRLRFIRHGDQIVWLDTTRIGTKWEPVQPKFQRPSRIYTFEIAKRSVRWCELSGIDVGPSDGLCGFDGHVAFDGRNAIDPSTGRVTQVLESSHLTIGVINGVAYCLTIPSPWPPIPDPAIEVLAIPLDRPEREHVVYRLPYSKVRPGVKPGERLMVPSSNLFFVADDTLRAWDGSKWPKVPLKGDKN